MTTINIKYDTPSGYFESLPDKIMQRIDFEEKASNKRHSRILRILTYAAAALIGFGIFYIETLKQTVSSPAYENENISDYYFSDYKNELAGKITDINVLSYIYPEDKSVLEKSQMIDVMNGYPSPITFYDNYDD